MPHIRSFVVPTVIKHGLGAVTSLADEVKNLGLKRPLIVTDPGLVKAGLLARVETVLQSGRVDYAPFDSVAPNPSIELVNDGVLVYQNQGCDGLIGLGGGSSMDTAKAIGVVISNGGSIGAYEWATPQPITRRIPPTICVPTTAGTGSEVTLWAVITDNQRKIKFNVGGTPLIGAWVALLDPELTLDLPPAVTAGTGMDALAHAIECYTCAYAQALPDATALLAMETVGRYLRVAFAQGHNRTARYKMMEAAMLGGGLDVLVLDQPDLNRLASDQQNAIVEWVRGGGVLVIWPGPTPIPQTGPIMDILPARLGAPKNYEIAKDKITAAGLAPRFAKLTGRAVEAISDDAKPVPIFGSTELQGHRRWVGLGQVMLIPADLSTLQFNTGKQSVEFWRRTLKDIIRVPADDPNAQPYYYGYGNDDPRRNAAIASALNWIADVPGAGSFGFSWVAFVLIAMMLIVGPVDWFVLKWMGRQPWTWITTAGWIGLVTLCAIYLGHLFKSGELHFRTVTMIDEAAGSRIAAIDLAGLYSPRTQEYKFDFDPQTWWRAASDGNYFGGGGLRIDIFCHQDYRGTRPLPMLVNVWNMRFLEGTDSTQGPAMLSAKLSAGEKEIQGTVTNESDVPVKIVALRTQRGVFRVNENLAPGASANVSGKLTLRDNTFASSRPSQQDAWRYQNQRNTAATTQPVVSDIVELSAIRSDRIEQALTDRGDVACVYAEFSSPTPRVKFDDPTAKRDQLGFVRALVTLKK